MNAALTRAGMVVVSLVIVWRVLQVNMILYDEAGRPRLPTQDVSPAGAPADRDFLKGVLHENPAQVDALLYLAREDERSGDLAGSRRAYQAAFELAPMDREVLTAGADFHLRQGDAAQGLVLLDRLADAYPESRERAFGAIARLLIRHQEAETFRRIQVRKPSWMGAFIVSSCTQGIDAAHLVPLLLERVAQGRAGGEEAGCVIDKLRDSDRWQQAYQVWLNTLPRERLGQVGHVFNGSFEYAASGLGFDWRPTRSRERDSGHAVDMPYAVGVNGVRALRVSYTGKRQSGIPIAQYLVLTPGRYELSGLARPQSITAGRGVQWTVRCMKGGKAGSPLATSERFIGSSEWRRFGFELAVPRDCPGQVLQLEALASGEGASYLAGVAWFDDLVLRRVG